MKRSQVEAETRYLFVGRCRRRAGMVLLALMMASCVDPERVADGLFVNTAPDLNAELEFDGQAEQGLGGRGRGLPGGARQAAVHPD